MQRIGFNSRLLYAVMVLGVRLGPGVTTLAPTPARRPWEAAGAGTMTGDE